MLKKSMKNLISSLGFLSVIVLVLSLSKRARKLTRKAIKVGAETAKQYGQQSKSPEAKKTSQSNPSNQENYPSYIGYGKSGDEQGTNNKKVRKINPVRYKNAQHVFNDEKMPTKMAEIAEEFDLNDKK
ncbi:hypothetical protein [Guptibacillus algicola]|uniref:hypothetical protein n=1 Tax=Guptibacillus algicola TaxID=225844 RepID=UPI001CD69D39|nr:hypothetical protein [Alkalihalobacillus algicola]MCA0985829.1 hypothetical protein [Alkalihalobacillus algicola]